MMTFDLISLNTGSAQLGKHTIPGLKDHAIESKPLNSNTTNTPKPT